MRWWDAWCRGVYVGLGKLYPSPGNRASLMALLLIVLLLQAATTTFDAITSLLQLSAEKLGVAWEWAALGFPGILLLLWAMARRGARELAPVVDMEASPRPVRCLILLLSVLRGGVPEMVRSFAGPLDSACADEAVASTTWGPPLVAIRHHLRPTRPGAAPRLERVVVLGTDGANGSEVQLGGFRALLAKLTDPLGRPLTDAAGTGALRVQSAAEALGEAAPRAARTLDNAPCPFDLKRGVEMENLHQLVAVLDALHRLLEAEYGATEVIVDITGQGKPATAAAVAVAVLRPRRRFQYVTQDRARVLAYDVTLALPEAPDQ